MSHFLLFVRGSEHDRRNGIDAPEKKKRGNGINRGSLGKKSERKAKFFPFLFVFQFFIHQAANTCFWKEYSSNQGKKYYYNIETKVRGRMCFLFFGYLAFLLFSLVLGTLLLFTLGMLLLQHWVWFSLFRFTLFILREDQFLFQIAYINNMEVFISLFLFFMTILCGFSWYGEN